MLLEAEFLSVPASEGVLQHLVVQPLKMHRGLMDRRLP
jgi:hypothetical protein